MRANEPLGRIPGMTEERWLSPRLDAALTGSLPCVVCGYELRGLSIRGICPECGAAIRATILYQVDPQADEFKPMIAPRITAWSILLWAFSGLVLMLACWAPRFADVLALLSLSRPATDIAGPVALVAAAASALGLVGMMRPTRETPIIRSFGVVIAILAYLPLAWAMWFIESQIDPLHPAPFIDNNFTPGGPRTLLRIIIGLSAITILLGVRPVARELVRRSLAIRTGRVDRQTLLAMVAALSLALIGDLLHLLAAATTDQSILDGYLLLVGGLFIILGSSLFSLGLVGAAIDSWRIRRAILMPAPSLKQVVGPDAAAQA